MSLFQQWLDYLKNVPGLDELLSPQLPPFPWPLPVPTNLKVTLQPNGDLLVTWDQTATSYYFLYSGPDANGRITRIADNSYSILSAKPGVYAFAVASNFDLIGTSLYSDVVSITVPVPTLPPSASINFNPSAKVGEMVSFNASVTDGQPPFSYLWDFGDGTGGVGLSTAHAYATVNNFIVKFVVTDALGRVGTAQSVITVTSQTTTPAPVPVFDPLRPATGLGWTDNGDGTGTAFWNPLSGATQYIAYFVPRPWVDWTRHITIFAPAHAGRWRPDQPGDFRLVIEPYGPDASGRIIKGILSTPFQFTWPTPTSTTGGPTTTVGPFPTTVGPTTTAGPTTTLGPIAALSPADKDRMLLPRTKLDRIRGVVAAQKSQWQKFILPLNGTMNLPIYGNYQASQGSICADYALASVVWRADNYQLASDYADKAIAGMDSLLSDYQKGPNITCQRLQRGDGVLTMFDIPDTGFIPESFKVYLGDVTTRQVKRSAPPYPYGNYDEVQYYSHFLEVRNIGSITPFREGVDWRRNDNYSNNSIEWMFSPSGIQPPVGSTYEVVCTSVFSSHPTPCTVNQPFKTFTLPIAPRADQYIFVEYCYHDEERRYKQTSEGTGGFNSVTIDSTYTSRSLGCNVALVLDWCWEHPHFSDALKQKAMNMLVRWADWLKKNGYIMSLGIPGNPLRNPTPSNYTMGHYVSWALTAVALTGSTSDDAIRHPEGARVASEVMAWRQTYIVPSLTDPSISLNGGFWAEGLSYGPFAIQNLLRGSLALEQLGVDISAERKWASQVIRCLIAAGITPATVQAMMAAAPTSELRIPTPEEMFASAKEDHDDPFNNPHAYKNGWQWKAKPSVLHHEVRNGFRGPQLLELSTGGSVMTVPATIYDGGDWFQYPAPFPGKALFATLADAADDPEAVAYASYICRSISGTPIDGWPGLVFDDVDRPTGTWESEPLEWFAAGTGLLLMRESWVA